MGYPLPVAKEFFAYGEMSSTSPIQPISPRSSEGQLGEYCVQVRRRWWLWRSLPFVDAIYLANSLTFNGLKDDSDIDLFIVTSPGRLWIARWWTAWLLWLLRIKKTHRQSRKRFCLSFYVSRDALDLQSVRLQPSDPYLIYRLAHLTCLYQAVPTDPVEIHQANSRIEHFLPQFPGREVICLPVPCYLGKTRFKQFIERLHSGWFGDLVEWVIKLCWVPILLWKKRKLWPIGKGIIISDRMLKFHSDQRKKYAAKWKVMHRDVA